MSRNTALSLLLTILAAGLLHAQPGCDVPMFDGARLFGTAIGAQMAVTADFNHDGFADLAVVNANSVSILLGNGDGTFLPAVNFPGKPVAIAVADFNRDGKLDLAIADNNTFTIQMLLGKGDGTFAAPVTAAKTSTGAIAVGDFNGDGKPDLAIGGSPAYILLGNGDGTFQAPILPAGNSLFAGFGVAAGDFNGDGKLDVIAGSNDGIFLMLGDGKGNLAAPVDISTGNNPSQVVAADLNGDRKLDVLTWNQISDNFSVLLGNGNGTFQAATTYPGPAGFIGPAAMGANLVVADLTGDGIPDVAVSNSTTLPWNSLFGIPLPISGTIAIYPGNGDGTFQNGVQFTPTGQIVTWMVSADFNGDGLADLAFTNNVATGPTNVGVLLGVPNGATQSPAIFQTGDIPRSPVLADFNGDGIADLVVAHAGTATSISVFLGNGDGSFQPAVNYPTAINAVSLAVGDVNGDGRADIVVANTGAGNLLAFLGNGDGTFQAPVGSGNFFLVTQGYVALGDFNNDGKLDAAVTSAGGVTVMLGNGDGTFRAGGAIAPVSPLMSPNGPLAVADLNGDGNLDVVAPAGSPAQIATFNPGNIYVFLGHGDGTLQAPVSYTLGNGATGVAIGDLNGDGKPDLVVSDSQTAATAGAGQGVIEVLLGNGDGTFQPPVRYLVSSTGAVAVLLADFNGDGNLDVAAISANDQTVTVLLGKGDGTFRNQVAFGAGTNPMGIAAGDLNMDGKPDLAIVDDVNGGAWPLLNTYVSTADSSCAAVAPLTR